MNNESIRKAMKLIGKVTVDTLPDILSLIPVVGIPIGTGAKILIGGVNENQDINENVEINNQIEELRNAINQKKISEKDIIESIQSQIMNQVNQEDEKKTVYMFGIILHTFNGEVIVNDIKEQLRELFSKEYVYKDKYKQLSEDIWEFVSEYFAEPIYEGDDFYFLEDKMVMNFFTDYDNYIRNEQEVVAFIVNLNEFLNQKLFFEYSIF